MSQRESLPLVSVGVPVFNGERYLAECLECLLAQDYPNLEIVVCDNASTDATRAILRRFELAHENIRVEYREENAGLMNNFLRVLELSRGDYFFWAAHDDRRSPHFVSKCLAMLEAEPTAVMCATRALFIEPSGAFKHTVQEQLQNKLEHMAPPSKQFAHFFSSNIPFDMYGLFRRETLEGLRFSEVFGPDIVFMVEVMTKGPIAVVEEALFEYRLMGKSIEDYHQVLPGFDVERPRTQMHRECCRLIQNSAMDPQEKEAMLEAMVEFLAFSPAGWRVTLMRENPQSILYPQGECPYAIRRFVAGLLDPRLLAEHPPLFSIVLTFQTDATLLLRSLESVVEHMPEHSYEVLLGDWASDEQTQALLASLEGRVRCWNLKGMPQEDAMRQLLGAARGEAVLWLEPGAELSPHLAEMALGSLYMDPELDAVAPVVVGPSADRKALAVWHAGFEGLKPLGQGSLWSDWAKKPLAITDAWRFGPGVAVYRRRSLCLLGDRLGWERLGDPTWVSDQLVAAGGRVQLLPASMVVFLEHEPQWRLSLQGQASS